MSDWVAAGPTLRVQIGCEFSLRSANPTSAVLQVAPHNDQGARVQAEWWGGVVDHHQYIDAFTNRCERFALPAGDFKITYRADVEVSAAADEQNWDAQETSIDYLPDEMLRWLMPSRFCQPDELGSEAWRLFGGTAPGWARVQNICDFVHNHLQFMHGSSNPWTTAADAYRMGQGVCRDYAHLAITFCRAMNIPARYAFGYIPDIGVPVPVEAMDFCAWFEVFLGGRWYTFDARNNQPRVGRVLVGRGADAVDVAQVTSFGAIDLLYFTVQADQLL